MDTKKNILKGAMILSVGAMISKILGIIYRIPLDRILGDAGNGYFGSAYQVYVIILTLTATAIPAGLAKLIADREALGKYKEADRIFKVVLKGILLVAIVLGLTVSIGANVISDIFFPGDQIGLPIRVLAPTIIITSIIASLRGYFQGIGNMVPIAESQVLEQVGHIIVTLALASWLIHRSLMLAVTGAVIGTTAGAVVALIVLLIKYYKVRKERDYLLKEQVEVHTEKRRDIIKNIIKIILPIVLSTSVFAIMTFIDYSMIEHVLPESIKKLKDMEGLDILPIANVTSMSVEEIVDILKGTYSFQYNTFINIPVSIIIQLAAASIPAVAASVALKDHKEVNDKIQMVFKLGFIIGAPCAMAYLVFGKDILLALVGKAGGEVLSVGAIGLIFITIAQLSAAITQAMGKPFVISVNAMIACGIKVVMNYILMRIPQLNVYGVIHSTTLCYIIYSTLNLTYLYKALNVKVEWRKVAMKPLLCAGVMGVVSCGCYRAGICLTGSMRMSMLLVIGIAVVLYFVLAFMSGAIADEDLNELPGGKKLRKIMKRSKCV